jgi:polar amino acid transport system substrate-binding protein
MMLTPRRPPHFAFARRLMTLLSAGALAFTVLACVTSPAERAKPGDEASASARVAIARVLAPTGVLRVGVYAGSPTSLVRDKATGTPAGIAHDLGHRLGAALHVQVQVVEFARLALVLEALRAGDIDLTFTNATEARAKDMLFAQPLIQLELGYLVPGPELLETLAKRPEANGVGSPRLTVASMADADRPGIRVGVSQGSSSQAVLSRQFQFARLVAADNLQHAQEMLRSGRIHAFATNKGILFEMSAGLKGALILPGRWGVENLAMAIPKGRDEHADPGKVLAIDYLKHFGTELRARGDLALMIMRAGLNGAVQD